VADHTIFVENRRNVFSERRRLRSGCACNENEGKSNVHVWTFKESLLPHFEPVQPELFAAAGGQPNCWADFDNDGDLDLFVGFKADLPNRLYRNDGGTFVEVGANLKIDDLPDTRAAAWGDFRPKILAWM
jgi:hypothetical protein